MALIAKKSGSFEPAPEGLYPAVCVDVADLGMVDGMYGAKHKCRVVWELAEKMADGRPYMVSKRYTVSLHEKASLHKDLRSWRGRSFTADELAGFDLEKVLGAPCQVLIEQVERDGSVFSNVVAVTKADKRHALKPSGGYVRHKDRPENQSKDADEDESSDYPEDGDQHYDDIPF